MAVYNHVEKVLWLLQWVWISFLLRPNKQDWIAVRSMFQHDEVARKFRSHALPPGFKGSET